MFESLDVKAGLSVTDNGTVSRSNSFMTACALLPSYLGFPRPFRSRTKSTPERFGQWPSRGRADSLTYVNADQTLTSMARLRSRFIASRSNVLRYYRS